MIFIFNRFLNIFLFSLIALQLISCSSDRRYSLSSDFGFVSRNNFIVYQVFAPEPPAPDDFLNADGTRGTGTGSTGGFTPKPNPDPKSKPDPQPPVPPQPPVDPQPQPPVDPQPPVPPQPPVDPQPDPQPEPPVQPPVDPQPDPSDPPQPPVQPQPDPDPDSAFCLFYPFFCLPQPPVDPVPQPPVDPVPQPPVNPPYTCDGLKCPQSPVQPQPPVFNYCDDFFDSVTGFDWSKLFSKEFSTCTWNSD